MLSQLDGWIGVADTPMVSARSWLTFTLLASAVFMLLQLDIGNIAFLRSIRNSDQIYNAPLHQ